MGLEASGWGMGGKKGTKGSYPEARLANGERASDAPYPVVRRRHPTRVAYRLFRVGSKTLTAYIRVGTGTPRVRTLVRFRSIGPSRFARVEIEQRCM